MIVKTIIMLSLYTAPIVLLACGIISSPWLMLIFYFLSGLGIAGIGMGIMHDANHGSYTNKTWWEKILGHSLDFLGCSSDLWKLQHNVLHHTYTNIHGHDDDIDAPMFLMRFSPHGKQYKIQRFQHYYVWFFYSLLTLYWVTFKDFKQVVDYRKKGLISTKREFRIRFIKLFPIKIIYFGYALVLPIIFAPFSAWWIILGFVFMHLVAGFLLSVVFQLAHVVPDMEFPQSDEDGKVEANWFIHQLSTTSNFSPRNRFLFWYFGGLTNQIEHHLFPNICHVHYRKISKLVAKTAKEFQLPYHVNRSFFAAIRGHARTLKALGTV